MKATVVLAVSFLSCAVGFAPPISSHHLVSKSLSSMQNTPQQLTTTQLHETEKKSSGGIDRNVSNKLLAETIAPFRGLRLFLYGAFASGAFVGGLITASGVAAALSGVRTDLDLNTEYMNLAIDFGAVTLFAVLAKLDLDKGAELDGKVEQKVERTKAMKKVKA